MINRRKRNLVRSRNRRGITVILVLGLLAVTIALSYAMLRTQATSARIQANHGARQDAASAAQTALSIGLRRMHDANWAGVNVPVFGFYKEGERFISYQVTFTTGDSQLAEGDKDYEKFPFRVTLNAKAWVLDPPTYAVASTEAAEAVVELVPRALSAQPANWASLQNHTVHQWSDKTVYCQPPVQIEGPVSLQGPLKLCEDYPPVSRPWHGSIDEVAIFNRGLTQTEVQNAAAAAIAGGSALASAIADLSPVHWWRLNESAGATTATDAIGGASGAYENGASAGVDGVGLVGNTAAYFDGRNDFINLGNLDIDDDELTLLAWFKAESWDGSGDARIISKATGTNTSEHYWMLSTTTRSGKQRLRFRVRTTGGTSELVASSGDLTAGAWYCAAAVYDGDDMILYLNGAEVGRSSKSGDLATNSAVPVYIGDNPPGSPQTRYLRDLEAMRAAGMDDWRPFTAAIDMPRSNTDDSTLAMLEDDLGTTVNDIAASNAAPVSHPGAVTSYRLYPGGKTYNIGSFTGLRTEDFSPDVETNPLGILRTSGQIDLAQGVRISGTIITHGSDADLDIVGDNVTITPVSLPPLHGTTTPIELPAAIAADDVHVQAYAGIQINGLVFAGDEFTFRTGTQAASCDFQGRLLARKVKMLGRTEWSSVTNSQWESGLTQFINQLSGSSPEPYFPVWLNGQYELSSEPRLKIRPRSTPVNYHWQDFSQPLFVPHTNDEGLLWRIVRWN